MEANELRVNNFVEIEMNTGWRLRKVRGYDIYNIHGIDEYDKANYRPIPLTEEWLLKFGFEKEDYMNNNLYTKVFGLRIFTIGIKTERGYEFDGWKQLKYVHSLQNLYFALTGEELTIKETTT